MPAPPAVSSAADREREGLRAVLREARGDAREHARREVPPRARARRGDLPGRTEGACEGPENPFNTPERMRMQTFCSHFSKYLYML